jgi:glycosyltransferase involved in cell wall biosynthesis
MRIGIDARFYGSLGKGLGRYTEKLIEQLEYLDRENEYLVFLLPENFTEYEPHNPRFRKVLVHSVWYSFSEQFLFPLVLLFSRLDIMHFPHFNVPLLYLKKFVVTIHDLILLHYPTLQNTTRSKLLYKLKFLAYRLVITSAIARAEHIITVSHFTEKDILLEYPQARKKISVTYEAADPFCQFLLPEKERELFSRINLLSDSTPDSVTAKPYCLYVGNAYPHKNLEAFLALAPQFPAHAFVLVGKEDYFYTRLKEKVREQKIQNIVFAGFVGDGELGSLYRHARCYIFPSLYEGFGLPPLEAMARGVPVLASTRGSLPEILSEAAFYFDPHTVKSLQEKLTLVLENESMRQEKIVRGYARVNEFSFKRMAQVTLELYSRCIKNKE